jgi:hypothetical protein
MSSCLFFLEIFARIPFHLRPWRFRQSLISITGTFKQALEIFWDIADRRIPILFFKGKNFTRKNCRQLETVFPLDYCDSDGTAVSGMHFAAVFLLIVCFYQSPHFAQSHGLGRDSARSKNSGIPVVRSFGKIYIIHGHLQ